MRPMKPYQRLNIEPFLLKHRQVEISAKDKKNRLQKNSPKKGMSGNAKSEHFT